MTGSSIECDQNSSLSYTYFRLDLALPWYYIHFTFFCHKENAQALCSEDQLKLIVEYLSYHCWKNDGTLNSCRIDHVKVLYNLCHHHETRCANETLHECIVWKVSTKENLHPIHPSLILLRYPSPVTVFSTDSKVRMSHSNEWAIFWEIFEK